MNERVGNERVRRPVVRTGVERPMAGNLVIDDAIILDFPVTKGLHETARVMAAAMAGADADLCDQFS
jgi:hypothetical protein